MPFSNGTYWFLTTYLLLLLASPLLNAGINSLSQKQLLIAICILTYTVCLVPALFNMYPNLSELLIFVLLYFISAYLRLYPIKDLGKFKYLLPVLALTLYCLFTFLVITHQNDYEVKNWVNKLYYYDNSPITIVISTLLILFCIQLKPSYSKVMNFLSIGILEIYLIHENPYIRPVIYTWMLNSKTLPYSSTWFLKFTGIQILKFTICWALGIVIRCVLNISLFKLIRNLCMKIENKNVDNKKELVDYEEHKSN